MILSKQKFNEIEKVLSSGNVEASLTFIKFNRRAWNTYRRIKNRKINKELRSMGYARGFKQYKEENL